MANEEQRIALFIDFENLAIGAKERGEQLNMGVVMDALSERGRVVARRAYADWNLFSEHRQGLVDQRIEMFEVPQRTGTIRKNAADIKLAVDALEMAFERDFITTFVIASGDSDFTPLVLKLRELNRRVIGVGVEGSTSKLLPGACDEFLYYERLLGPSSGRASSGRGRRRGGRGGSDSGDLADVTRRITSTLTGLQRSMDGSILSSMLKRAMLRKDPAFSEGDLGFRTWSEFMRHLQKEGVVSLAESGADGDPVVDFPSDDDLAFVKGSKGASPAAPSAEETAGRSTTRRSTTRKSSAAKSSARKSSAGKSTRKSSATRKSTSARSSKTTRRRSSNPD